MICKNHVNVMGEKKNNFLNILNKTEEICLVIMFALMVIAIFLQIIMRFVFNNSLSWSEELGKFIFVWISWLGISIGQRKNEHIKITMIINKLPLKLQNFIEIIANMILIAILAVTIYYAVLLVHFQQNVNYAGIKISTSWGYLSLVLGCSFMGLRIFGRIYENIRNVLGKSLDESMDENVARGN
ncbi:TRAP transporter small permease [Eubacteriales bacterium KG126]